MRSTLSEYKKVIVTWEYPRDNMMRVTTVMDDREQVWDYQFSGNVMTPNRDRTLVNEVRETQLKFAGPYETVRCLNPYVTANRPSMLEFNTLRKIITEKQDERIFYRMEHSGDREWKLQQGIQWGPPVLVTTTHSYGKLSYITDNHRIIRSRACWDSYTSTSPNEFPLDWSTPNGLWASSEYEYMARELR